MKRFAIAWAFVPIAAWASVCVEGRARAADVQPVALPEKVACALRAGSWWLPKPIRLELAPGIPYTEVSAADDAQVLIPVAPAPAPVGVKLMSASSCSPRRRPARR